MEKVNEVFRLSLKFRVRLKANTGLMPGGIKHCYFIRLNLRDIIAKLKIVAEAAWGATSAAGHTSNGIVKSPNQEKDIEFLI